MLLFRVVKSELGYELWFCADHFPKNLEVTKIEVASLAEVVFVATDC